MQLCPVVIRASSRSKRRSRGVCSGVRPARARGHSLNHRSSTDVRIVVPEGAPSPRRAYYVESSTDCVSPPNLLLNDPFEHFQIDVSSADDGHDFLALESLSPFEKTPNAQGSRTFDHQTMLLEEKADGFLDL